MEINIGGCKDSAKIPPPPLKFRYRLTVTDLEETVSKFLVWWNSPFSLMQPWLHLVVIWIPPFPISSFHTINTIWKYQNLIWSGNIGNRYTTAESNLMFILFFCPSCLCCAYSYLAVLTLFSQPIYNSSICSQVWHDGIVFGKQCLKCSKY